MRSRHFLDNYIRSFESTISVRLNEPNRQLAYIDRQKQVDLEPKHLALTLHRSTLNPRNVSEVDMEL